MKFILSIFCVCFFSQKILGAEVAADGTFALYSFDGSPTWTEQQKNEIIANGTTATRTITSADFTDIRPNSTDIALATSAIKGILYDGVKLIGRFDTQEVKNLTENKGYLKKFLFKIYKERQDLIEYQTQTGEDTSVEVGRLKSLLSLIQRKRTEIP